MIYISPSIRKTRVPRDPYPIDISEVFCTDIAGLCDSSTVEYGCGFAFTVRWVIASMALVMQVRRESASVCGSIMTYVELRRHLLSGSQRFLFFWFRFALLAQSGRSAGIAAAMLATFTSSLSTRKSQYQDFEAFGEVFKITLPKYLILQSYLARFVQFKDSSNTKPSA